MSCFKIFFISIKILFVLSGNIATAKSPNQVIAAKVNNHIITAQDVLDALKRLPEKIKEKPLPDIYPNIVNELINQHLITKQAYLEKIDLNKNVIGLVKKSKDQIIARYWLKNFIANQTKEEKIKSFYQNYLKNFKTIKEYNASHILVKNKVKAEEIIKKLKIESKFSELARLHSIGPSGKNEGKLGWFKPGQMVKEFEKATFSLQKGTITDKPIKTKFGYHIIRLNDIRDSIPKKLDDIKESIIDKIRKDSLLILEKKIRSNQNIIIVDFKDVADEVNN